jgi:16S rRNA (uracil1498-N3)-methyltransferase
MRVSRFYTAQVLHSEALLTLDDGAALHIAKVLRLGPGARVVLFDGIGGSCMATLEQVDRRHVSARLGEVGHAAPPPLKLHLGIGLSRGERMDYVVQKATELGVSSITPLHTQRSEVRLDVAREARKCEHWQRIAISACEQSGLDHLPRINRPLALPAWQASIEQGLRLVLDPDGGALIPGLSVPGVATPGVATPGVATPDQVSLLIGPEGGLDPQEVAGAVAVGFTPVALGPRILRTETAPVVALGILQYLWGDLGPHPGSAGGVADLTGS